MPAEPFGVLLPPKEVRGCALQSLQSQWTGVLRADDDDDELGKIPARSRPRFHKVAESNLRESVPLQPSRAIWTKFPQMFGVKERVTLAGAL
jgi:hypothetical protein